MKYWYTRYALSAGIQLVDGEPAENRQLVDLHHYSGYGYLRKDTFPLDDRAVAESVAEKMRVQKIDSLRKQIAKLEKLTFASPTQERP